MAEGSQASFKTNPYLFFSQDLVQKHTHAKDDGRVDININPAYCQVLRSLVPNAYTTNLKAPPYQEASPIQKPPKEVSPGPTVRGHHPRHNKQIHLNIVIHVVGSRGDVQPFVALASELRAAGHRVRLATHKVFEEFVRQAGIEFYPIGGDPAELMAFMVKNPGLIPSMDSLVAGDIQRKRKTIADILHGCWESCIESDPRTGTPFVADVIIANPPSFGHIHCAQALAIPVHLMFTMPWTSTKSFPHPLANIITQDSSIDPVVANYLSYWVMEWLTWQGLGDVINKWRAELDLEPIPTTEGPLLLETQKIPVTYCWSPALIPKPTDWSSNIDICGFIFREYPTYEPPQDLLEFLNCESPPVYIGFGSIVIDDPQRLNTLLLDAVRSAGVRAIISKGWSNLGGKMSGHTEKGDIFYLEDCPHEWLFQRVSVVIHHGGAGTTACGILNGRPTIIIPFFGDQSFWGGMVASAGAGPKPIPYSHLTRENLTEAIHCALSVGVSVAAHQLAVKVQAEHGVQQAVDSFHKHLTAYDMRCDLLPDQPAVWRYRLKHGKMLKLSKVAAEILLQHRKIEREKLKLLEINPISIENRRWDPVTGTTSALISTTKDMAKSTVDIFRKPATTYRTTTSRHFSNVNDRHSSDVESPAIVPRSRSKTRRVEGTSSDGETTGMETALSVAAASASGVGGFFRAFGKGFFLDMPMACTEGLRNMPRLYGEEVRERGNIRDWRSGIAVGGTHFVTGISEGLTDLFAKPFEGGRQEGALGAIRGVGKGLANFASKTASGPLGLVAYSFQGVYQSIRSIDSRTDDVVKQRKRVEGAYLFREKVAFRCSAMEKIVVEGFDTEIQ